MATQPAIDRRLTLPGAEVEVTPFAAGNGLPLFIQPLRDDLAEDPACALSWMEVNRTALKTLILEAGAIVLRGFAVPGTIGFGDVAERFGTLDSDYTGGATPRARVAGKVFEATRAPAAAILGMHQEMAYLPHYPAHLAFFCRMPAASGGETFIADMRRFTALLPARFRNRLEALGVRYTRNFRSPDQSCGEPDLDVFHKSWTEAFSTTDRDAAIAQARGIGLEAEWLDDGSMSASYRAAGLIRHPATGETLSFNQIPTQSMTTRNLGARLALYERFYGDRRPWPYVTTYGDGSAIDPADLDALHDAMEPLIVAFPWSAGDVMILDNFLVAHGRNAYAGKRDVQVALLN